MIRSIVLNSMVKWRLSTTDFVRSRQWETLLLELTPQEFERIGDSWALATPGGKHDMLRCVFDSLCLSSSVRGSFWRS